MKKFFLITILSLFSVAISFGENNLKIVHTLLDSANAAYSKKQYDAAVDFYKKILELGYVSPEVYYNLGNSYFKQNKITDAIYYYEKALKLAPNDKDIKYNLSIANQYITDKIKSVPEFFLTRIIHKIADLMSSNQWAITSLILFVIAVISALWFLFSRSFTIKRITLYVVIIGLLISAASLYFSNVQYKRYTKNYKAIVFAPTVTIKSSPDKEGNDLMIIHEGLKVEITDSLNNWYEIKLPDGNKGWTEKQNVKKI
jgi:tetratricopeptide (TPR) repeat protein